VNLREERAEPGGGENHPPARKRHAISMDG